MGALKKVLAGLGGAIALNILHESLKKTNPDMPRVDLLGEEALQKGLSLMGAPPIANERNLYLATLGADVVSNAGYYSLIGAGKSKNIWTNAFLLGTAAGIGAVLLPKKMGLNPEPVNRTPKTGALTIGYYLFGALVTAAILEATKSSK